MLNLSVTPKIQSIKDIIENADSNDWSYQKTRNKIIKKYQSLQLQPKIFNSSNSQSNISNEKLNIIKTNNKNQKVQVTSNNQNSKSFLKCDHCNRKGHDASTCWGTNPCPSCGIKNTHHNPAKCRSKSNADSIDDDDSETDKTQKPASSSSSSTNKVVKTLNMFQEKNKKAKT